jgi:hypothetical protein
MRRLKVKGDEPMKTNSNPALAACDRWMFSWKFKGWTVCGVALVSFAAGSLITARLMQVSEVKADSDRAFELLVYHAVPGKAPALESIFRDVSKLQAKHDINVVGYWMPNEDPAWANTFIYLVAHRSREMRRRTGRRFMPTRLSLNIGNRLPRL